MTFRNGQGSYIKLNANKDAVRWIDGRSGLVRVGLVQQLLVDLLGRRPTVEKCAHPSFCQFASLHPLPPSPALLDSPPFTLRLRQLFPPRSFETLEQSRGLGRGGQGEKMLGFQRSVVGKLHQGSHPAER